VTELERVRFVMKGGVVMEREMKEEGEVASAPLYSGRIDSTATSKSGNASGAIRSPSRSLWTCR